MPLRERLARTFRTVVVSFPRRTSATQPIPPPRQQQWQRVIDKLQRLVLEDPQSAAAILNGLEQVLDDRLDDTPAA
jgi:hypothetical protein